MCTFAKTGLGYYHVQSLMLFYLTIIYKIKFLTVDFFWQIDIPTHLEDSFHRGNVYVGFKNAVTQPSSALRHATELKEILKSRNGNCMSSYYVVFPEAIG